MRFRSPSVILLALLVASLFAKMKPGYGFSGGGW